jgi:hypothetical protein
MPALYEVNAPNMHKIPLKHGDVYMVNHKKRLHSVVLQDCNDLYHSPDWEKVPGRLHVPRYKHFVAKFEDGDRVLN